MRVLGSIIRFGRRAPEAARLAARPLIRRASPDTFPRKGGRAIARSRTPLLRHPRRARFRLRPRRAGGVERLCRKPRPARPRFGAARLDDRRRPRRPAAARLHPARRPLAAADDRRRGRSALSGDAARLRGRPLLCPPRRRLARDGARRRPVRDPRPRRLGRLDADDAGRAADRAARRPQSFRQAQADRARLADRRPRRQGRASSTAT